MFHYDIEMEDIRIIASEHRVPLDGEELEYATRENERRKKEFAPHTPQDLVPLDKHDGTFDVLHRDGHMGRTKVINLTHAELADVIYLAAVGDEQAAEFYDKPSIKRYQELMKDCLALSLIL